MLSQCPELLQQHSRVIVPLFLGFMQYQYLGDKAFPDDPETRAVEIAQHLTPVERAREGPAGWGPVVRRGGSGGDGDAVEGIQRTADRRSVRARLGALLRVFAAASGPKSLYKHRVLFRVYRALLVMPDEKIAVLALRCMLSYKPPFLVPYKVRARTLGFRGSRKGARVDTVLVGLICTEGVISSVNKLRPVIYGLFFLLQ